MGSFEPKDLPEPANHRECCQGPMGRYVWRIVLVIFLFSLLLLAFRYWTIRDTQASLLYVPCLDDDVVDPSRTVNWLEGRNHYG
jgi:hypothetical protein